MIYYVRHGQTTMNKSGHWNGFVDSTLTATGVKQAIDLGYKTKDVKFDLVFCSPLIRAKQTAELVLSTHPIERRVPIITDSRIMEWYSGDYEGFEWNENFRRDFYGKRENYDFSTVETFESGENRIKSFLDEMRTKFKDKNILVVAHGGIARLVYTYFHGMPKSGLYLDCPEMKNCELIEFSN